MKELLPALMLAIAMLACYFTGRKDGMRKYDSLLQQFNLLQKLHNDLLKKPWSTVDNLEQNYWKKEDEFHKNHNFNHTE